MENSVSAPLKDGLRAAMHVSWTRNDVSRTRRQAVSVAYRRCKSSLPDEVNVLFGAFGRKMREGSRFRPDLLQGYVRRQAHGLDQSTPNIDGYPNSVRAVNSVARKSGGPTSINKAQTARIDVLRTSISNDVGRKGQQITWFRGHIFHDA